MAGVEASLMVAWELTGEGKERRGMGGRRLGRGKPRGEAGQRGGAGAAMGVGFSVLCVKKPLCPLPA
jgi:hypothetical protein